MHKILEKWSVGTLLAGIFILSAFPLLIVEMFPRQFKFVMDPAFYIVFHNIAEFFSIMVSLSMFGVSWYTFEQSKNRHALFLGTAFLAIGIMDFMHTFSMVAMPDFITPNDPQKSVQFWIPVRLFQAVAFLASAYVYPDKSIRWLSKRILITSSLLVSCLVFIGIIFFQTHMPTFFIFGVGVTPLKKFCEYLIIFLLGAATVAYWRRMERTGDRLLIYYLAAFVVCIFSELPLAFYARAFDTYNLLGHINKIVAFFLIYYGVYRASVKEPYIRLAETGEGLKREVAERKRAEEELQKSQGELEKRVQERTEDLQRANAILKVEIEERSKVEYALRESQERYRALFNGMTEGFALHEVICDQSGKPVDYRFLDINPAFERLTGLKRETLIGKTVLEAIPETEPVWIENYGQVALTGQSVHFDRYFAPLGKHYEVFAYRPAPCQFAVLFMDITERKLAEEVLRDYIQLLDDVIDGSTSPIFLKDYDGRFITINASLERMLGRSRQELKGKTDYDIAPKEVADYWRSHDTKVMATGKAIQIEEVADLQDGHHIFLANKFPLVNAHGQVYGVGTISHDITERKRMEEELRRSRDELDLRVQERTAEIRRQAELLDLAHDAIIVREMDGAITFWNEGATEMYGWRKEEALGKISCDFLETGFPISRDEITTKVVQEGRWEGELTHTRKDGKKINVLTRWALQKDKKGRPTGIMQINHDITQRLKLEEQLRQAQKMEAIGTLTGGIAHDFNNILGAIVINSEMALLDLRGESALRTNLDLILRSGLRGKDLVRQMLLFSRKSEQKQEVLTLTPLIKETFKLLRSSLPTTIQMKLHLETESDSVSADPSQIQQVILNLCTNAAYAMRGTTGSIDISLQGITFGSTDLPEADMEPGDYLVLSVKDTGSGMDEEVKKRIFEPFFTTKPVGEGTGLGLSVVYGIVKNHKGNITVYSEPARGSIFKVYLPRVDTGASVEPEAPKPIPRGNERILVVDDEEFNIKSVQNMLQHLGYKVTALMDSQEALRLFSADPAQFDLVITDQTMPFMTGEDLGRELMRMRPDIPVILCTGYSDLISSGKAKSLGFQGYIMKPFTIRESAELVRRALDQKEPGNLKGKT